MVEPRSVSKVGVTPGKLVLVLVLAVVFVSVLLFQLGAKESPSTLDQSADVAADSDRRPRENSANTSVSPPNNGDVPQQARRWPEITLEEIQQHDPFAFPAVLAPPAAVTASDRSKQRDGSARRAQMQRERKEDLAELCQQHPQRFVFRENLTRRQIIVQSLTFNIFHHEIVVPPCLADVKGLDNIVMVELGGGPTFSVKAFHIFVIFAEALW